jgi:hypothetical protein
MEKGKEVNEEVIMVVNMSSDEVVNGPLNREEKIHVLGENFQGG